MDNVRIAIIHDWLTGMRGGEKCLEVFCELFPKATVFTLIHKKGSVSDRIEAMDIRTSWLQYLPGVSRNYRNFLPFFPSAIESFDLSGYDLVLSSSHCVAKGVKSPKGALHICYCYTPVRYAWNMFDEYFGSENPVKKALIGGVLKRLKKWDLASNKRIDYFLAISDNVKNRIRDFYGRASDIIYPPVDVASHEGSGGDKGYYLIVSALVPYKRVDLAVKAFNESGKRLVVIGEGSDTAKLSKAAGDNITFLGWAGAEGLREHYSNCRALIFPGEEDFGIVPLEAQAHGKPVIAYGKGGVLETVVPFEGRAVTSNQKPVTGVFFAEQTVGALNEAVDIFEKNIDKFDPAAIRENALRFGRDRFKKEIGEYVSGKWEKHRENARKVKVEVKGRE